MTGMAYILHPQETDPSGPLDGTFPLTRGGNWYYGVERLRIALRNRVHSRNSRLTDTGFRLVLVAHPQGDNNSVSGSPIASDDYAITSVNQSITLDVLQLILVTQKTIY